MSLRQKFRESIYDDEHKPRLNFARNYFFEFSLDKDIDFEELEKFYVDWREYPEYLVLQKQTDELMNKGNIQKETVAFKCSKRGNDVYWWRIDKRLRFLNEMKDKTLFDPHSNSKHSNVIFATLTYNINRSTKREAWETIGEDFNNWIRNLRKKFGRISCLRGWEASQKGFPHIHVLMIFHDFSFKIAFQQMKKTSYGFRQVYRIQEKEEFKKSWHSFVDVQAIRKMGEGISYVTKYMTKSKSSIQTLTLALCWLFKKRSFAVSGDFYSSYKDMIHEQKKSTIVQTDLVGGIISLHVVWVKIGEKGELFSAKKLGIDLNEWRKVITDRKVLSEILA